MLKAVDVPVLVKKANNEHDPDVKVEKIFKVDGIGPMGLRKAMECILSLYFK